MGIELLDRSKYLKGLLILARKDNQITPKEREILKKVGKNLSFEERFIETAINEVLDNEYLTEEPPVFSNIYAAESFIKNGILLASVDKRIDRRELLFLTRVAEANKIGKEQLRKMLLEFCKPENIEGSFPEEKNEILEREETTVF